MPTPEIAVPVEIARNRRARDFGSSYLANPMAPSAPRRPLHRVRLGVLAARHAGAAHGGRPHRLGRDARRAASGKPCARCDNRSPPEGSAGPSARPSARGAPRARFDRQPPAGRSTAARLLPPPAGPKRTPAPPGRSARRPGDAPQPPSFDPRRALPGSARQAVEMLSAPLGRAPSETRRPRGSSRCDRRRSCGRGQVGHGRSRFVRSPCGDHFVAVEMGASRPQRRVRPPNERHAKNCLAERRRMHAAPAVPGAVEEPAGASADVAPAPRNYPGPARSCSPVQHR